MTPIADIVKYIDFQNKSVPGQDDFTAYVYDALQFSNSEARELMGMLYMEHVPVMQQIQNAMQLQQLLRDKFVSEYGEKTKAWLHEHEQPFSKAANEG
jgi:beta-lactamase class D